MRLEDPAAPEDADVLRDIEHRRLRSLVTADSAAAEALHAADFQLVTPSGGVWSKEHFLAGIAAGRIDYRRFEAVSDIEVMVDGNLAVLRYRSEIDILVEGQEGGGLSCWHADCYRRDRDGAPWQAVWSQATEIEEG
jgi:hypothetical protein